MKRYIILLIAFVFSGIAVAQTGKIPTRSNNPQPTVQPGDSLQSNSTQKQSSPPGPVQPPTATQPGTSNYPQHVSPAQPTMPHQSTVPSSQRNSNTTQPTTMPLSSQGARYMSTSESQSYFKDMILIQYDQLPVSLQQSLRNEQYTGWQNARIYQDVSTQDFFILMQRSDSVEMYKFNRYGDPIKSK